MYYIQQYRLFVNRKFHEIYFWGFCYSNFSFFSLLVFLKIQYKKSSVFNKKQQDVFWWKIAAYRKKKTENSREAYIIKNPKEGPTTEDPNENRITQDPKKRTLSLRTLRSFKALNNFWDTKISCFLVMVYIIYQVMGSNDGDRFSYKNYGLGRPRFHTAINWK